MCEQPRDGPCGGSRVLEGGAGQVGLRGRPGQGLRFYSETNYSSPRRSSCEVGFRSSETPGTGMWPRVGGAGTGRWGGTWDLLGSKNHHDLFRCFLLCSKPRQNPRLKATIYDSPGFCGPGSCRAPRGGPSRISRTSDPSRLLHVPSPSPRAFSSSNTCLHFLLAQQVD